MSPGQQAILKAEIREDGAVLTTEHGEVWRIWIGHDGLPLIQLLEHGKGRISSDRP